MKKCLAILGMITCMVGLTACGSKEVTPLINEQDAVSSGQSIVESLNQIVSQGAQDQYAGEEVISSALDSWSSALVDMGSYVGILETTTDIGEKEAIINVTVDGTEHDAVVEIIIDDTYQISSITTNVQYSMGEIMTKAALNTLIGMGTVFVVLILISFIISAFAIIPKIQKSMEDKKKAKTVDTTAAVDNTIAQIVEKEELSDDLELVAVIAAAIAASEGAASTDGFVVRSIRRR